MKIQFVIGAISTLMVLTFLGLPQGISAEPNDTETPNLGIEADINQKDQVSKSLEVGKQIQIMSDVTNNQDRPQPFAYIVQIKNDQGVVVSLAWLTGELTPGQFLSPALSWIPQHAGVYTATIFVWEGIDNPLALSHPLNLTLDVQLPTNQDQS